MLFSDASDSHVGALLEHEDGNGEMKTIFSMKSPPSKQVRSTFYKKLRGVYLSLENFQARVLGRELIIRTVCQKSDYDRSRRPVSVRISLDMC